MKKREILLPILLVAYALGATAVSTSAEPQDNLPQGSFSTGAGPSGEVAMLLDEIESNTTRKTRLESEALALGSKRQHAREALRSRARALYRLTRTGILPLSGRIDSLLAQAARIERLKHLVIADIDRLHQLDARSAAVQQQTAELSTSLDKARARLVTLQKRAIASITGPGILPASGSGPSGSGAGFREPGEDQGFYGIRVVDGEPLASFARERGNLAIPLSGEFAVRDAKREESEGPGLEFLAPAGTQVRAAAAGRVAFSDRYGSYGRLVILDHGENYYTVYGGLGSVEVRVGDDLSRGARIGSIGNDRPQTALFFEVRRGTKSLPPRSWLGL